MAQYLYLFKEETSGVVSTKRATNTYHACIECMSIIEVSSGDPWKHKKVSLCEDFYKMTKGLVNQSYGGLTLQVQLTLQLWENFENTQP